MEVENGYTSDTYEQDIEMNTTETTQKHLMTSNTLMWTIDEYNFATKRGKIIRTIRERYLRDDLHCSLSQCTICSPSNIPQITFLSPLPREKQYILPSMDVVLYQMDVLEFSIKKQNAIHDKEEEIVADVIILETVWEYVKRHDLAIYNRLRALIKNPDRRFIVFANEHHQDCYIPSTLQQQSIEKREAKALAKAYQWYKQHLQALQRDIKILLLVNDTIDAQRLKNENIPVTLLDTFLAPYEEKWPQYKDLMVLSSVQSDHSKEDGVNVVKANKKMIYTEYLPLETLQAGVNNKTLFQGTLRCNRDNWLECTVLIRPPTSDTKENDLRIPVLISGREAINRGMDGDIVVIQILPPDQWKRQSKKFISKDDAERLEIEEENNENEQSGPNLDLVPEPTMSLSDSIGVLKSLNQATSAATIQPMGKVVGILQRNWRKYCGSLQVTDEERASYDPSTSSGSKTELSSTPTSCLVIPVDRKVPKIRIRTRQRAQLLDKRILVAIDSWPVDSMYPVGHYLQTLGTIGEKETETNVLLLEHNIPFEQFSDKVLACLPPVDWKINEENSKGRTDLRHLPVMSVDPPNCKDIDDALHVLKLPNGNIQVGVHIADVTHFVHSDTPIDVEAADRGTSTYLVDKRLDMLPSLLTTKLCSLTSVEPHFAFSVLWEIKLPNSTDNSVEHSEEVVIENVTFCKSIIQSIASLSYQEAQEYLDDPTAGEALTTDEPNHQRNSNSKGKQEAKKNVLGTSIKTLHAIAVKLRKARLNAGALTLASPEVKFVLDTDTQNPLDVQMYTLRDTNAMVEEFMLLANITVAKKITRSFPTLALLRRHPAPSKQQFEMLQSQAKSVGVTLKVNSSKELQESLDQANLIASTSTGQQAKKAKYFNKLLRILCTRCMMPAAYFSSGEFTPSEFHHYGLATNIYTHFTSPIRRYADVMVHRLLAAAIGVQPLPQWMEDRSLLKDRADALNKRHHNAQLAGRASVSLHTVLYFAAHPTTTDGVITKVKHNGVGVLLPQFGIEGMILLTNDKKDNSKQTEFHEDKHELIVLDDSKNKTQVLKVFDAVRVRVYVALTFGNRQELRMELADDDEEEVKQPVSKKQRTKK